MAGPEPAISRELTQRLDAVRRSAATAAAQRIVLNTQEIQLTQAVARAKGEVELKPEVEEVLETLQNSAHERSVGAFERLLTAIVNDVLPDDNLGISLDLHTDRNMPALDISVVNNGKIESIYDGNGGALTNVVCTGLRFIALARSGLRRFIVLDEADCWISPKNVPAYFNVVASLAREAQIQTILITHHNASDFSEDFHILEVAPSASTDKHPTSRITPLTQLPAPGDDADGYIAWVELENFARFEKVRYDLSSGVTAIVGDHRGSTTNNIGKSVIGRAFKAAFLGEGDDSMIRHDAPFCIARFGFSDGRVFEYKRMTKGNPKAVYTLHTPDSYAGVPGAEPLHQTPAAKLPEWVAQETGIGTVDGLDVQIGHQKKSVFMLDEPASKRASLLSIGRESGFLHAMSDLYKDDLREKGKVMREGEKSLTVIKLALEHSKGLQEVEDRIEQMAADGVAIEAEAQALAKARDVAQALAASLRESAVIDARMQALAGLSDPPAIENTSAAKDVITRMADAARLASIRVDAQVPELPTLEKTTAGAEIAAALKAGETGLSVLGAVMGRIPDLPEMPKLEMTATGADLVASIRKIASLPKFDLPDVPAAPTIETARGAADLLKQFSTANAAIAANEREQSRVAREMQTVEAAITQATDVLGNECPTCHGHMDADVVLGKKEHAHHDHEDGATRVAVCP